MDLERREKFFQPVKLTPTQEQVAQVVVDKLTTTGDEQLFLILEGLSGVGKSTLIDKISVDIGRNNGKVVKPLDVIYHHSEKPIKNWRGHFVTMAVPTELEDILQAATEHLSELSVVQVVLPAMDESEIMFVIKSLKRDSKRNLSDKEIATYSLGIPYLACQLSTPGLTESSAARVSAGYLSQSLRRRLDTKDFFKVTERYLKIAPNSDVLSAVKEIRRSLFGGRKIYDELYHAFRIQSELESRGIVEESPLFVCPESEEIYNAMLKKGEDAWIDIYVPFLGQSDFDCIQQSVGFYEDVWDGTYDQHFATRTNMFLADYRKTHFWSRNPQGIEFTDRDEYAKSQIQELVREYEDRIRQADLSVRDKSKTGTFLAHSHDHGGLVRNPVSIGWMLESLLQQKGVPYFVHNRILGADYIYNPEINKIEIL
ncbi:hypothetical protein COT75_01515 [Candidatus Beckwithbacteria bacterium CG10_big_fil_rev_8_21_14_0_10_34_10]|uniref:Uncharacterized protein n=1 Tax=Candidatus Beckwithbacteria bacterium CG10_big_fil_rev_8_21_14_0_10_34_10 TaxID=1974495 RepID=A0A2H0WC30_9BACT|nr:MAG: hypothetical protein COT75_01515 [Candidatus Beckwithbacteria bacterium CG10_big_fil_rev_8_21_14_0_10_34_10]